MTQYSITKETFNVEMRINCREHSLHEHGLIERIEGKYFKKS